MHLVVIDNFDSFTFNLVNLFKCVSPNSSLTVLRNHLSLRALVLSSPSALVISPGPGSPKTAGLSMQAIDHFHRRIPILGVCLGMQCLNEYFGGRTVPDRVPTHGKTSALDHDQQGLFYGLPRPLRVARYHSLKIQPAPLLKINAWCGDVPMAVAHPRWPSFGVQFHPESFLAEGGENLVANFLRLAEDWRATVPLGDSLKNQRGRHAEASNVV